jgi:outer membrane protein TolC
MRENAVATARAKRDKAAEQEVLARQQVAKEVNQAALMLAAAEKNVEASRKGLEQAEEQFRIIQERYASGRGIQLEVLDAQVTLTRARFNVVSALADYEASAAMWLKATGRAR